MTMTRKDKLESATRVLMRDFGYEFTGSAVYRLPAFRFGPKEYCFGSRSQFDAAESLIPIIRDERFHDRLNAIRSKP